VTLAHSLTPGGPDIEVLLIAVALLAVGLTLFFQKSTKPAVPIVLLVAGFAVAGGSFAIGRNTARDSSAPIAAPEGLSVTIVSPEDNAEVPANEVIEITAEIDGGELTTSTQSDDPAEGHLHYFVDDRLVSMPATPVHELELEPGSHTIVVEFTTADHRSFEPRVFNQIEVTAVR
jgi:hypothetical protein